MSDREATVHNPIFARWILPRVNTNHDARGGAEHRRELLAGLSGRVIEVGAGMGSNFGHYPRSVKELVATEPESYLRSLATRAAATASIPVRVVDGLGESLPMDRLFRRRRCLGVALHGRGPSAGLPDPPTLHCGVDALP